MSGPSGNQLVLFPLESWCFPRLRLGKQPDSRENKTNCFSRDLTLSVYTIICLYYSPQKVCNFHMYLFQIKLKYDCSKPMKLQKFLMWWYNKKNVRKMYCFSAGNRHFSKKKNIYIYLHYEVNQNPQHLLFVFIYIYIYIFFLERHFWCGVLKH